MKEEVGKLQRKEEKWAKNLLVSNLEHTSNISYISSLFGNGNRSPNYTFHQLFHNNRSQDDSISDSLPIICLFLSHSKVLVIINSPKSTFNLPCHQPYIQSFQPVR